MPRSKQNRRWARRHRGIRPSPADGVASVPGDNGDGNGGGAVALAIIEFSDGGPPEKRILHRGTLDECKRVADTLRGVTYSGLRLPIHAIAVVCTEAQLDDEHPDVDG